MRKGHQKEVSYIATTRLIPLHTGKGRAVGQGIRDIIDYTETRKRRTAAILCAHVVTGKPACGFVRIPFFTTSFSFAQNVSRRNGSTYSNFI